MQSKSSRQDGHAEMSRTLIRKRRGDGGSGRSIAGFAIPTMALAGIALLVLSCGDGTVEPPLPPPAPVATTVAVNPASATLTSFGETTRLTAEVRDQNGNTMAGATVNWTSSDASVASVDASGLVTAAANGSATITAMSGSASGTAAVTVAQAVSAVAVSPTADTLVALGDTLRLVAEAMDAYGHNVAGAEFSWSSSDRLVARVDDSGLVTGNGEGLATIIATAGDAHATAEITVENPDRAALVALYEATDGPNWVNNENWLTDLPLGNWYGVHTDGLGRVVGLNLDGNMLEGPIPRELGSMVNLVRLRLDGNNLVGPILSELANLTQLRTLNLYGNALEGRIPPELGRLVNLDWLPLGQNNLVGPIPSELANLTQLRILNLYDNALEGRIPPELGSLGNLESLSVGLNKLDGPIPQSFLQLDRLQAFYIGSNEGLCVPGTSAFAEWMEGIEHQDESVTLCNAADVPALRDFHAATGGSGWTRSDGWSSERPVEEWHGVRTDSLGRVTALDLERNGLSGRLPASLGSLAQMTELRIGGNRALSGPLPLSLAALSLHALHYEGTSVCAPSQVRFREWLNAIPSHEGTGASCVPPVLARLSVEPPSLAPAEAGKQGRDTIYVTVTDAAGAPVADASYQWTTDRNSGWVFPAEGRTSADGRISATWVAGWPGNGLLSLSVENPVSALTTEIPTRSTGSANPPAGALYVHMNHDGTSAGYSIDITPLTDPQGTYYATIQWDGGYTGLQRAGSRYDRQLQFSMWNAPGFGDAQLVERGEGVVCRTFGGEGTGQACELEYPWSVGSTYRFEVTEQEMNGGSAMTLHVTDLAASQRRFVGTLRFARRARMHSLHMFVEDFWTRAEHCLAREVRSAAIRRAMILIDGEWQPITAGQLGKRSTDPWNPGTPACANLAGRAHASGLEVVIGGEEVSDPNGSIRVTIPN